MAGRGGVGGQPLRRLVNELLVGIHVHYQVPQGLQLLPDGRALGVDGHERVAGPQGAHPGDVGQDGAETGRLHEPDVAVTVQHACCCPGGVGRVVSHLGAGEEVDGGEVVGLAVGPVVSGGRVLASVAAVLHDGLGAGVHELASVLEVVGVPGLQGRHEHQLQRDGVGEALLEVPACAVAVDFVAVRDAGGCDAGLGVLGDEQTAVGEATVSHRVSHGVMLAHLPAAVVVGDVDGRFLVQTQLGQAEGIVDHVGTVVVFARDLVHPVVQLVPLEEAVTARLLVHHVAHHARVEVVVEVVVAGHAMAEVVQRDEVGHVDLVLQRVAQDAVVPLGEVRDAVGDVVDGGGEVSEVLRVDAVSGHGGVADLLLQVEPAGGIDGVTVAGEGLLQVFVQSPGAL